MLHNALKLFSEMYFWTIIAKGSKGAADVSLFSTGFAWKDDNDLHCQHFVLPFSFVGTVSSYF
jgi:hypothetical protein